MAERVPTPVRPWARPTAGVLDGDITRPLAGAAGPLPNPRRDFSAVPLSAARRTGPRRWSAALETTAAGAAAQAARPVPRSQDALEREADRVADLISVSSAGTELARSGSAAPSSHAAAHHADERVGALGPGAPLDDAVRAEMERGMGRDFGHVRVHTDARADRAVSARGALACTLGRHIAFRQGRYAPSTADGRRLLAHELAHVVQQQLLPRGPVPQLKAVATRFQDEPTLDAVSEGRKVLKEGDKGEAVIRITTALSELGHYKLLTIDESFDPPLTSAVSSFQVTKGLKGSVPDGTVETKTFGRLDKEFSAGFGVERGVLGRQKAATILGETQSLDPAERVASARAISTEPPVNRVTGLPPVFRVVIPAKGAYGARLRAVVENEILSEWSAMAKGKTAEHPKPGALYGAGTIDPIALEAQKAVNGVFGEYMAGRPAPALTFGVTVQDAWKEKEDEFAVGGAAAEDAAVDWRVQKILDGDDAVKALDREHGAIQSRAAERAIVGPIKSDLKVKHRAKLLELHKAWPGFASGGVVYVQLFKGATADKQRYERWDFFQTFIHEYIHSLEHPDHVAYRTGVAEQKGGFTLREGTTDYFTKIVWSSLTVDDALRARIEGPVHDPKNPFAVQRLSTYTEAENAERLAGVVGIRNVAAAFFLGKVDLIGKP